MLTELHIVNFKCFRELNLPLRPLTLLSGVNSAGKSSVIQSLALLSHTLSEREWSENLLLDVPELALGSVADVLNQGAAEEQISLGASTADQKVLWRFRADDRERLSVDLDSIRVNDKDVPATAPLRWLMPADWSHPRAVVDRLRRTSWITAERTGPRDLLPLRDKASHTQVGSRGELAAGLLHWKKRDATSGYDALLKEGEPPILENQVSAWMQGFFPGCDLRVSPIDGASAISLQLRSSAQSEFRRPQNVGFGLTQLFPVIVAVLAADADDCLLIENPEVHLHPKAQQGIGSLLAVAAASGVQVIVETHSDHVLNGLRLATKKGDISPEQVAVYFFAQPQDDRQALPDSPRIDADGRFSDWPDGFFDQFGHALSDLL